MKILLEFLSAASSLSSKRLAWLPTTIAITIGMFWLIEKLCKASQFSIALDVWYSYVFYSLVLGGFVTADIIERILNKEKSRDV